MTENDLFAWIIDNLQPMMIAHGAPADLEIVRGYQVSQQGRTIGPTVYINRQDLKQHGSPRDYYRKGIAGETLARINEQVVILQIQFQAALTYDPNTGLRVGDFLNLASRIMGLPRWRNELQKVGVQMLRIETNGITYAKNDRDQYEAVPVVTVSFSYTDTLIDSSPIVDTMDYKIQRV